MPPPNAQGLCVPEDVVRLIFDEIVFQHDRASFHTAALLSSTFLYVAQLHLFRFFTFNIADPASVRDALTLLDVIQRSPYIATFIKHFTILDLPPTWVKKKTPLDLHDAGRQANHPYLRPYASSRNSVFSFNANDLLPRLCRALTSVSTLNFSCQLDWHTLHYGVKHALEGLFTSAHLVTARLNGLVNLPQSISNHLYNLPQLEFTNCHFAPFSHPHNAHIEVGSKVHLRRLSVELGQVPSNFDQVQWHWHQHGLIIPQVDILSLSINGWYGIWDVALMLGNLGSRTKSLSLSTTHLELGFVRQQPPTNPFIYPPTYATRVPRIDSHAVGECFATDECDRLTHMPLNNQNQNPPSPSSSSWFIDLMWPLRPRFHLQSLKTLHKLEFQVSHWRSAIEAEANGELFWMIGWLAELPLETAENVRQLSIVVRVGTDFCFDNVDAFSELVGYQGWGVLDMIIGHPHWSSLEMVSIIVRSRTSCLSGVKQNFGLLLDRMKSSRLPLLNARKIVDVSYLSMESTSHSAKITQVVE